MATWRDTIRSLAEVRHVGSIDEAFELYPRVTFLHWAVICWETLLAEKELEDDRIPDIDTTDPDLLLVRQAVTELLPYRHEPQTMDQLKSLCDKTGEVVGPFDGFHQSAPFENAVYHGSITFLHDLLPPPAPSAAFMDSMLSHATPTCRGKAWLASVGFCPRDVQAWQHEFWRILLMDAWALAGAFRSNPDLRPNWDSILNRPQILNFLTVPSLQLILQRDHSLEALDRIAALSSYSMDWKWEAFAYRPEEQKTLRLAVEAGRYRWASGHINEATLEQLAEIQQLEPLRGPLPELSTAQLELRAQIKWREEKLYALLPTVYDHLIENYQTSQDV